MAEAGALMGREAKPRARDGSNTRLRRFLRGAAIVILVLFVLPYLLVPVYAFINPPITPLMLQRAVTRWNGIHKDWVDLEHVSPNVVRAVVASEDARFCSHHGIDWTEVQNAMQDDDGPRRGASTITMQVARNLFFPNSRSWIRKAFEAPLALYTDFVLSKRRILELYLNTVEWGDGIYGVEEAAQRNFGVSAARLSGRQSGLLAAALPSPIYRVPAKPTRGYSRLANRAAARASSLGPAGDCVLK